MTEAALEPLVGHGTSGAPVSWYRFAIAPLAWAIVPGGPNPSTFRRLRLASIGIGAPVGVAIAQIGRAGTIWVPVLVIGLAAGGSVVLNAISRWAWPWQVAWIREARRSRRQLEAILGPRWTRATAEKWLVRSDDAPPVARYLVLQSLGRAEEADALIESFPVDTGPDRLTRVVAETGRTWRTTRMLDIGPVLAALPDLDAGRRAAASTMVDLWRGAADVSSGRDLRAVSPPPGPPATVRESLWLWARMRLWPIHWLVGACAVTWVLLGLLARLIAR
jgi:hypothetical protein